MTATPPAPPAPSPDGKNPRKEPSSGPNALVRAEQMMQIAFIFPAAVVAGWLIGAALDRWLHQHWIYLAGIVLGCVAGFVDVFRVALGGKEQR